jgi:hypothetical protein
MDYISRIASSYKYEFPTKASKPHLQLIKAPNILHRTTTADFSEFPRLTAIKKLSGISLRANHFHFFQSANRVFGFGSY